MKKLLIIDGNSIINRAFYGIKLLTTNKGMYTNGIYGFLNIMLKHMEDINPEYVAVAFDLKAPTFRHKMYDGYKAQRKGMPSELAMQMPVMKEILRAMNVTILEKEGYEADDIIGTVSRICRESEVECLILTGDKDDLQLATDTTRVLLTVTRGGSTTTTEMDSDDFEDTYGITPEQFVDVKGLMGDSSDNVPGVKGIGEKTAFEYIKKFGSVESLYENLDDSIIKPAARQKLVDGKDMAILSKKLCTIDKNVPLDFAIEDAAVKPYNTERLTELYTNLEFSVFLKKLGNEESAPKMDFYPVEVDCADYRSALADCGDTLVYKLFEVDGELCAFAFLSQGRIYFVRDSGLAIAQALLQYIESEDIVKVSSDIKGDMVCLNRYGIEWSDSYFDVSVAAYILNPLKNSYDISSTALEFLSVNLKNDKEVFGSGKSMKTILDLLGDELKEYIASEITATHKLWQYEKETVSKAGQDALLYDMELPLIRVLATMETKGFLVDREHLSSFNRSLKESIDVLESEIYELAGEKFNINSPKQLGVILFEKLGLKSGKKTKTGYSTNAEVLEKLAEESEIVRKILEYRQLAKLKSTYGDGLLSVIDEETGRIYSKFNQTVTVTGRISSTEPNLQNIPVRTELGREIRKMFIAKPGCVLVDADYSQIELRVLAHISGDEALCDAFKNGTDVHTMTAASVFGVNETDVTPLMRSHAKTVNFGIMYGMGEFSLAKDLGISVKEAREYIENYFDKYKGVKSYMESIIESAKESGYVETMFARRRTIAEINSSNFMVRSAGERMVRNTPIQGSAADIIKIAMVSVERELRNRGLKSSLILQVHDELIIEAYEDEAELAAEILKTSMENAAKLVVPLVAEAKLGKSWYDAK
ncbi:MAG: DNA polymerase I [Clostridia bacterium]|nr:DNA polymerase I [Clostridia bacterium]